MMQRLVEGQVLSRRDIAVLFGGNARAFLPRVNGGDIVAGCFDPDMNPRVPYEILVHDAPNVWEYVGRYRAVSYTEDPDHVSIRVYEIRPRIYERHVKAYGHVRGILFLEEAN
jgi:hypothetical protein